MCGIVERVGFERVGLDRLAIDPHGNGLGGRHGRLLPHELPGVLVGERRHLDHHGCEAGVADQLGVGLHHVLLGGHEEDLHLTGADVLVEDLEIERDVVDVERDVLLGLPVDGLAGVVGAHLVHDDLLDDDGTTGDGRGDWLLRQTGLLGAGLQGLDDQLAVHDLAVDDGLGRQIGRGEMRDDRWLLLQVEPQALDDAGADVHARHCLLLAPEESEHRGPTLSPSPCERPCVVPVARETIATCMPRVSSAGRPAA